MITHDERLPIPPSTVAPPQSRADDRLRLDGRVALVTGSSRGIGAAIARCFAAHGAAVALHGRDRAALGAVRAEIERTGGRAQEFVADVTRPHETEALREQVEAALGPIDILVANAGGNTAPPQARVEDLPVDAWSAVVDENLTSTYLTLRAVLPGMRARGRGRIVTISSAAARRPTASTPVAYAAAKSAIAALTQVVAAQAGPAGVRVNCLAPETILTERNRVQIPPDMQTTLAKTHPLARLGIPEDVADAALFLVSDMSDWITGVVLDVAGGAVLR